MPVPFEDEMAEFAPETTEPPVAPADLEKPMFKHALASVRDELLAMDASRLVPVNVDIPTAITVVLGAAPAIRRQRAAMAEWFGEEMAGRVDRLDLLARALGQAHAGYRREESGVDLQALAASASEVRAALHAELRSLEARKLVKLSELQLSGGTGFRLIGFDLLALVSFFGHEWDRIGHVTSYDMGDIERAEGLANQLITAVGVRDQAGQSPSGNVRQRAFSLLYETYDEVRSMLAFLRWKHGDADRIAPSWHLGKKARRARAEVPPAPGGDLPAPGMPGAPAFEAPDARS